MDRSTHTHDVRLLQWSVEDLEGFWGAIWDYFQIISHSPHSRVLTESRLPVLPSRGIWRSTLEFPTNWCAFGRL